MGPENLAGVDKPVFIKGIRYKQGRRFYHLLCKVSAGEDHLVHPRQFVVELVGTDFIGVMQFIGYLTQAVNRYTVTLNDRQRNGL